MAALSFDSAYRQVKGGRLAPVYYLSGDEDILKGELVDLIVEQAVDAGARDFNVDRRSAPDIDGETMHALVETPPMLAERRVVVIRSIEQWRRNAKVWQVVERYVRNPSPSTVLILVQAAGDKTNAVLARAATHVVVEPLSPERVARWVRARAARVGLQLSNDGTRYLVDAVGPELAALAMEIEKIAAATTTDQPVEVGDVASLIGMHQDETPASWLRAVLERDTPRAIALLEPVLAASGMTAVRLLTMLGSSLIGVRLAVARRARGDGRRLERALFADIRQARPYGLGDWKEAATQWANAAARWSSVELDEALRAAYDADRALKSTTVTDDRGILSTMLLRLTPRRVEP